MPLFLKEKFNREIKNTFIICPEYDKKVVYCFTKDCGISWDKFAEFLAEEGKITEEEIKLLIKEGFYELQKGGY